MQKRGKSLRRSTPEKIEEPVPLTCEIASGGKLADLQEKKGYSSFKPKQWAA